MAPKFRGLLAVLALAALAFFAWRLARGGSEEEAPRAPSRPTGHAAGGDVEPPRPAAPGAVPAEQVPAFGPVGILKKVLERHHLARMTPEGSARHTYSTFHRDAAEHYLEARLFARAYPDEAEREAVRMALDPSAPPGDRQIAMRILHELGLMGRRAAQDALLSLARKDDDWSRLALGSVAAFDAEGGYRQLYWQKARAVGNLEAIQALGNWSDSTSDRVLDEIVAAHKGKPHPQGTDADVAERIQTLLRAMDSPSLGSTLAGILGNPKNGTDWISMDWALRTARSRKVLPEVLPALRRRLDAGEALVGGAEDGGPSSLDPGYGTLTGDSYYDDVLVAFLEAGGKPTAAEAGRLRAFGYGVDARERLHELIPLK